MSHTYYILQAHAHDARDAECWRCSDPLPLPYTLPLLSLIRFNSILPFFSVCTPSLDYDDLSGNLEIPFEIRHAKFSRVSSIVEIPCTYRRIACRPSSCRARNCTAQRAKKCCYRTGKTPVQNYLRCSHFFLFFSFVFFSSFLSGEDN